MRYREPGLMVSAEERLEHHLTPHGGAALGQEPPLMASIQEPGPQRSVP